MQGTELLHIDIDIEILFFVEYYITIQHKPCRAFISKFTKLWDQLHQA